MSRIEELITLSQTKFLNFYEALYKNKKGEEKRWTIVSRKQENIMKAQLLEDKEDDVDAVLIVARHEETNQLVLIRQFRIPINDYIYELPAGLIDKGESYETSAKRELKEETGLDLIEIKECASKVYLSPGMTDESVALIHCTCKGEISKAYMEADEDIEPMTISKETAKEILNSGHKIDAKAYLILKAYSEEV